MKYAWTLLFALTLVSCNGSDSFDSKKGKSPKSPVTEKNELMPEPTTAENKDSEPKLYDLQVTIVSFLEGGLEACDVKDKIYSFSMEDRDRKIVMCKNSKVEVSAVSDSGVVTFQVTDVYSGVEFPKANYSDDHHSIELGKERKWLRYSAQVPNAFTYIKAEDFTGIDSELRTRWNELNNKLSKLRETAILAERNTDKVPNEVLEEIYEIETEMAELSKKMEETQQL